MRKRIKKSVTIIVHKYVDDYKCRIEDSQIKFLLSGNSAIFLKIKRFDVINADFIVHADGLFDQGRIPSFQSVKQKSVRLE